MKADAVKGNVHHQQNVNTTTNNMNEYLYIWHPQFFSEQQQLQPLYPPSFSSSSLLTITRNKIASFSLPHLFSFTFSLPWSVSLSVFSCFQLRWTIGSQLLTSFMNGLMIVFCSSSLSQLCVYFSDPFI
jgi:hypothetical protein